MPENKPDYEALKSILKSRLNEKRYYHSLCVAKEAERLAEKYGGDAEKACLAGLLHDITKNAQDEEHLKIFREFGIILSDVEKNAKKLWHAMSGAEYVKHVIGISDPDIIDAYAIILPQRRICHCLRRFCISRILPLRTAIMRMLTLSEDMWTNRLKRRLYTPSNTL